MSHASILKCKRCSRGDVTLFRLVYLSKSFVFVALITFLNAHTPACLAFLFLFKDVSALLFFTQSVVCVKKVSKKIIFTIAGELCLEEACTELCSLLNYQNQHGTE